MCPELLSVSRHLMTDTPFSNTFLCAPSACTLSVPVGVLGRIRKRAGAWLLPPLVPSTRKTYKYGKQIKIIQRELSVNLVVIRQYDSSCRVYLCRNIIGSVAGRRCLGSNTLRISGRGSYSHYHHVPALGTNLQRGKEGAECQNLRGETAHLQ